MVAMQEALGDSCKQLQGSPSSAIGVAVLQKLLP